MSLFNEQVFTEVINSVVEKKDLEQPLKVKIKEGYNQVEKEIKNGDKSVCALEVLNSVTQNVFGDFIKTGQFPNKSAIHDFNSLVVRTGEAIVQPQITDILSFFAEYDRVEYNTFKQIKIDKEVRGKFMLSASTSAPRLRRVFNEKSITVEPQVFKDGFNYDPKNLMDNPAKYYNMLIADVGNAKIKLYLKQFQNLIAKAVSSSLIPANNVLSGANNTYADFSKKVGLARRTGINGRPVLIADALMINDLAGKVTGAVSGGLGNPTLVPDGRKDLFFSNYAPTNLGVADAFEIVNDFTSDEHKALELSPQDGYMLANGRTGRKPIEITEYGGLTQRSETNFTDGLVKTIVELKMSMDMLYPHLMYVFKDTNISI